MKSIIFAAAASVALTCLSSPGPDLLFELPAQGKALSRPHLGATRVDASKALDETIRSIYTLISGPAGQKRDWKRFLALFDPQAQLVPLLVGPQGRRAKPRWMSPAGYVKRSGPMLEKRGFYEVEIARKVQRFGMLAQVWSSYETRWKKGEKPFMRGINAMQLVFDGQRWSILQLAWQPESKAFPLPKPSPGQGQGQRPQQGK